MIILPLTEHVKIENRNKENVFCSPFFDRLHAWHAPDHGLPINDNNLDRYPRVNEKGCRINWSALRLISSAWRGRSPGNYGQVSIETDPNEGQQAIATVLL